MRRMGTCKFDMGSQLAAEQRQTDRSVTTLSSEPAMSSIADWALSLPRAPPVSAKSSLLSRFCK